MESFNYRVRAFAEFEAVLRINVMECSEVRFHAVTDITVGAEKTPKDNAISVYIARGNDTLWEVCKELGVSAEKIAELNPDVKFPLCGSERIIVYRNI